jgi:hypothetical protein
MKRFRVCFLSDDGYRAAEAPASSIRGLSCSGAAAAAAAAADHSIAQKEPQRMRQSSSRTAQHHSAHAKKRTEQTNGQTAAGQTADRAHTQSSAQRWRSAIAINQSVIRRAVRAEVRRATRREAMRCDAMQSDAHPHSRPRERRRDPRSAVLTVADRVVDRLVDVNGQVYVRNEFAGHPKADRSQHQSKSVRDLQRNTPRSAQGGKRSARQSI